MNFLRLISKRGNQRGASFVEYLLIIVTVSLVCIVAVRYVGDAAAQKYCYISNNLEAGGVQIQEGDNTENDECSKVVATPAPTPDKD